MIIEGFYTFGLGLLLGVPLIILIAALIKLGRKKS